MSDDKNRGSSLDRAAIMELDAGRRLDALVAEHVLGCEDTAELPPYSTDASAAWALVMELIGDGENVSLDCTDEGDPERWWSVSIGADAAEHPSMMVALCRAALLMALVD